MVLTTYVNSLNYLPQESKTLKLLSSLLPTPSSRISFFKIQRHSFKVHYSFRCKEDSEFPIQVIHINVWMTNGCYCCFLKEEVSPWPLSPHCPWQKKKGQLLGISPFRTLNPCPLVSVPRCMVWMVLSSCYYLYWKVGIDEPIFLVPVSVRQGHRYAHATLGTILLAVLIIAGNHTSSQRKPSAQGLHSHPWLQLGVITCSSFSGPSLWPFLPAVWWSSILRLKIISRRRNMFCTGSETDNWKSQSLLQIFFFWVSWFGHLLTSENTEMTGKQIFWGGSGPWWSRAGKRS